MIPPGTAFVAQGHAFGMLGNVSMPPPYVTCTHHKLRMGGTDGKEHRRINYSVRGTGNHHGLCNQCACKGGLPMNTKPLVYLQAVGLLLFCLTLAIAADLLLTQVKFIPSLG